MKPYVFAVVLLGVLGCKGSDVPEPAPLQPTEIATEPEPKPAKPTSVMLTSALAAFDDRARLIECEDSSVRMTGTASAVANARKVIAKRITARLDAMEAKARSANFTVQRLTVACADQFRGRTVLASCLTAQKTIADPPPDVELVLGVDVHHYDYARVGEDDSIMLECMKDGGKWDALDRNSSEWLRAKSHHNLSGVRDLLGK